jgi:hypothetical protein
MCRLFYNLGFKGKYIIFDLPPFSALQKFYLKTIEMPIHSIGTFSKAKTGAICLSDIHQLTEILKDNTDGVKSLFIATWSMSEIPIVLRNSIIPLISKFKSYLIAYQDKFGKVDNLDYFNKWKEVYSNIIWNYWQIKHIPGNNYLVGWKNMCNN